ALSAGTDPAPPRPGRAGAHGAGAEPFAGPGPGAAALAALAAELSDPEPACLQRVLDPAADARQRAYTLARPRQRLRAGRALPGAAGALVRRPGAAGRVESAAPAGRAGAAAPAPAGAVRRRAAGQHPPPDLLYTHADLDLDTALRADGGWPAAAALPA